MPVYGRHFEPGELQFITTSTYRRPQLFGSGRFRGTFVEVLREVRQQTGFLLIGWVLMPEHALPATRPPFGQFPPTDETGEAMMSASN